MRSHQLFLSSYRVHVEQVFGELVARWRIIHNLLNFLVDKNARIVCDCQKLNNFLKDRREKDFLSNLPGMERGKADIECLEWYYITKAIEGSQF